MLEHEPQRLRWSRSVMRAYATPSAAASDWAISEIRARASRRPCSSVRRQAVEAEARRGGLRELPLEPAEVGRDRGVDLRLGRARPDDELGREAVANDDAVAADALRPAYVQLDQTAADLDEAHGWTVGVAPDGNARDTTAHEDVPFALR